MAKVLHGQCTLLLCLSAGFAENKYLGAILYCVGTSCSLPQQWYVPLRGLLVSFIVTLQVAPPLEDTPTWSSFKAGSLFSLSTAGISVSSLRNTGSYVQPTARASPGLAERHFETL